MDLTHIDEEGRLRMVNVGEKDVTIREAHAEAMVVMAAETLQRILGHEMPKGNVLEAARLAGIMAAKRTWELIPLCHPIQLTHIQIDFFPDEGHASTRQRRKWTSRSVKRGRKRSSTSGSRGSIRS